METKQKKVGRPKKAKAAPKEQRHGWNSEPEVGVFLASLIRLTGAQTVLEIGVFEGYTAKDIVDVLPKGGLYIGIDIKDYVKPENKAAFIKASKEGKVIEQVIENSLTYLPKLPKNHFDIVFIDSQHTFEHVIKEFKMCESLITKKGIIAFHDSIHVEDVKKVVDYAAYYNYETININTPEGRGIALVTKK